MKSATSGIQSEFYQVLLGLFVAGLLSVGVPNNDAYLVGLAEMSAGVVLYWRKDHGREQLLELTVAAHDNIKSRMGWQPCTTLTAA